MPDLAIKANDVLTRALALKDAEKGRQAESQFAQRRLMLQQLQQRLQAVQEFMSAAAAIGFSPVSDALSMSQRARDRLDMTRTAFKADPEVLLDETSFRSLIRTLEAAAEALEQAEVAAWAHYAKELLPPPLGGDEQLLRADPRTSTEVIDRLIQWDDFLRRLAEKPRPSPGELAQFATVLESRNTLWAGIPIEQQAEVVDFIRASGAQGAALVLLTDQVRSWLLERGLIDAYVIKKKD